MLSMHWRMATWKMPFLILPSHRILSFVLAQRGGSVVIQSLIPLNRKSIRNSEATCDCSSMDKIPRSSSTYDQIFHFFHFPIVEATVILLLLTLLFLACVVAISISISSMKRDRWPPCPTRLPLLGNLHQIMKGDNILSTFTDMAKTYGPVMTVWMGLSPIIILTGQTAIWEALVNQASNFSDRSTLYSRQYTTANFKTILVSSCNERWTKLRKLLRNNVLSPFHIASQSSYHQTCIADLFNTLEKALTANDGVVKPLHALKMTTVSFLARLCFGADFQDHSFLLRLNELMAVNLSLADEVGTMLLDSFPRSRYFVPSSRRAEKKWKSLRDSILQLFSPLIQFARSYRVYFRQSAPDCYLNCLLSVGEEDGDDEGKEHKLKLSDEEIALNLFELFLLAIDSSSTALEWALTYLITYPHIQERAYQEARNVAEGKEGKLLCLEDLGKLPYLQAVVKETLRKESIAPLAITHQTVEECKIMGITIPSKSSLFFNLSSVCNDPGAWKDPEEFMPERFLGTIDSDKVRMSYLPFGAGRRICAGMDLATVHVPVTLANLLVKFQWACVKEGNPPDLTRYIPSFIMEMKYPLEARISCR